MSVQEYQIRCSREYKHSVGLPDNYRYLYGNPVGVLVPIESAVRGVMIVGAYPSAKFGTVNGVADVPLFDTDSPFSSEQYFDGSRVRQIPSGRELEEHYLQPLGVSRKQCWVTNLVKCFLFKPGHVRRYERLGVEAEANRAKYRQLARRSVVWLTEEVQLAQPKLIVILGAEPTEAVLKVGDPVAYLGGTVRPLYLGEQQYPTMCLPHPGILMRNPQWRRRFEVEILPQAQAECRRLLG